MPIWRNASAQTDGYGGFTFAGRSRINGGNQNQPALFSRQFERFGRIDFGFVMTVRLNVVGVQAQLGGNFANRAHGGRLGDFGIGFEAHDFPLEMRRDIPSESIRRQTGGLKIISGIL
uniref:Uncharacterized protein n=1 Tax=Neisseria meningitidis alpha275 TaxID=295996 RepID=C6SKA9_NEIME|nr:hypothetical protein predicted by Glimmer/Critica [Neisseria meningitidis alpha275]